VAPCGWTRGLRVSATYRLDATCPSPRCFGICKARSSWARQRDPCDRLRRVRVRDSPAGIREGRWDEHSSVWLPREPGRRSEPGCRMILCRAWGEVLVGSSTGIDARRSLVGPRLFNRPNRCLTEAAGEPHGELVEDQCLRWRRRHSTDPHRGRQRAEHLCNRPGATDQPLRTWTLRSATITSPPGAQRQIHRRGRQRLRSSATTKIEPRADRVATVTVSIRSPRS
jgi:hypothetical protein